MEMKWNEKQIAIDDVQSVTLNSQTDIPAMPGHKEKSQRAFLVRSFDCIQISGKFLYVFF